MPLVLEEKTSFPELKELYADLHRFGEDLREAGIDFQEMVRAGGFPEHGRAFAFDRSDPNEALNRSIDITRNFEFLVAVTGAFSSGKSTLLNLLLAADDLLPASVIPMTAVCTAIRHGPPRVDVRYVPREDCFARAEQSIGRPLTKPFTDETLNEALEHPDHFVDQAADREQLRRFARLIRDYDRITADSVSVARRAPFIAGGATLPAREGGGFDYFPPTPQKESDYRERGGDPRRWVTREWLALIRDVTLWIESPLLQNDIVILDLPGLNCREDYHRRAIQEYCTLADCIIVTAFQPGNQADEDVVSNFKALSNNHREKMFFVFNKVDQFLSEPHELVRAVDYLTRDTIGGDFPRERFFLTSAQIGRASRRGDDEAAADRSRLADALAPVADDLPGLGAWVGRAVDPADPGGVDHLRDRLKSFLLNDAYPSKIAEVVRSYRLVLDRLRDAAEPTLDEMIHMDADDILRNSLLEYFRHVETLHRNALYNFRFDYLRGQEGGGRSVLGDDLKRILDETHRAVKERIRTYFDRPILTTPIREDPVSEFDLLRIADDASQTLRRELQETIINAVHDRVCSVFKSYLSRVAVKEHLENLFRASPEWVRRMDAILDNFQATMLHSLKCIVRNGFFHMPRGRKLKRLERGVSLARLKPLLVEVFSDFYPAWIYENIYTAVIDHLWLSLFLDAEDLGDEVTEFFKSTEAVVTGAQVGEQVEIPEKLVDGSRDLYRTVRTCQRIDALTKERVALEARASRMGVPS